MSDVRGLDAVRDDVQRSLDLFLGGATFRREMGGTPRRGLLFEGPPGTGKTHLAKAMAAEAGVPFLFVSGTAFQSMYYGATARKIRAYFRALRRAARSEGGAIGFIEEIDAIATTRGGLSATPAPRVPAPVPAAVRLRRPGGAAGRPAGTVAAGAPAAAPAVVNRSVVSEGVGGVVNELLVQMQSFDTPTGWQRVLGRCSGRRQPAAPGAPAAAAAADRAGRGPARGRHQPRRQPRPGPAAPRSVRPPGLLRRARTRPDGGSSSTTSSPARRTRRRWTTPSAGTPSPASPQGYTPVMIEQLLDEALVQALRRGAPAMSWTDVERARLLDRGRPRPARGLHRARGAPHRDARGGSRRRRLARGTAPQARGADDRQAGAAAWACSRTATGTTSTPARARELLGLLRIAFGGQAAEELFFGDVSTGPGGDLQYATVGRRPDGRGVGDGREPRLVRGRAGVQPGRPGPRGPRPGGPRGTPVRRGAPRRSSGRQPASGSRRTGTWSRRCGMPCWSVTS